ncbi:putative quinol monooxygenase [Aestuariivivens sediminis]|uniref:putative quinol monooxygenase n=1 Tax=Aestuariivivens sediminis TaxID=2913557 RepID=UPI001F5AFB8D|nr:putative quinol monooxygenase [Aestuariivivens sediminis]
MKNIKSLAGLTVFIVLPLVLMAWWPSETISDHHSEEQTIVLLNFKAQPEKGDLAVSELTQLLEEVRKEPHFGSITLHVDPNDSTNILLYEAWDDISYYNTEHMNTPHLKAFMVNSKNFLTGPPDITYWSVKQVFKK